MKDQMHEPAYRAALENAHAELLQLADTVNRLRARQEQINSAVESLKLLVNSPELAIGSAGAAKSVYAMSNPKPQQVKKVDRAQVLA
ncbi:MAG TPA: hypothetical protein VHZ28_13175 [Terracidiphilus sp.]|jgi:hypothetical protein|nr:hypothetical protein [Terracidiphilus sp.]